MKNHFETLTVLISRPTQTVLGLKGLVLHLSALEIYPEDPGQGTPMLFEYKDRSGHVETMTWCCGYEGGNLCEIIPPHLMDAAQKWMDSIAPAVSEWETFHWDAAVAAKN